MMSYREWRSWLREFPWSLRWFPLLVLLRPLIDQFWNLKGISPFISPLYWVGILTPILCVVGMINYKSQEKTQPLSFYNIWSLLVIVNGLIILFLHLSFIYLILFLKISLPVYLFYFLRVFIMSKRDLIGILTSFIYSWGVVIIIFIYELLFGARSTEITRHNLERWEGGFADVLNYALYSVSGFIVMGYFFFQDRRDNSLKNLTPILIALIFGILILGKIYHTTSFFTISALIALTLFRIFKEKKSIGFIFTVMVLIAYSLFGEKLKQKAFDPLVQKEIVVYEEGTDTYRQFNGRMGRWIVRWKSFNEGNLFGKMVGSGLGFFGSEALIGSSVHNDFFRIIFYTGFLGFISYLLFFVGLLLRRKYLDEGDKYILEAGLIMLMLYSITTVPTMYAPFMYFLLSVFAYASLPLDQICVEEEIVADQDS
jgi:hypothetical protein